MIRFSDMEIIEQVKVSFDALPFSPERMVAALLFAAGLLYCFLGYRLLKFLIGLTGCLLAGIAGFLLGSIFLPEKMVYWFIIGAVGGCCGVVALLFLYHMGIFLLGSSGVFLVVQTIILRNELDWSPWVSLGIGLAGGLLALVLEKPLVVFATSAVGAFLLVGTANGLLWESHPLGSVEQITELMKESSMAFALWFFLTIGGGVVQLKSLSTRRKPTESSPS